jgi:hypothetical protein
VKLLALAASTLLLATSGPVAGSARYLEARQAAGGGFSEAGRAPDPTVTAWTTLALVAADGSADALARAQVYLAAAEQGLRTPTDLALNAVARAAAGERPTAVLERLRARPPDRLVNASIWTILALRQAGEPAPAAHVRAVRSAQRSSGGWGWFRGGAPDSNDTAAAIQALRAAGVRGRPIARGLAFLRAHQNRDGGFELTRGRGSDTQSTAWAIQAFLAAGARPGPAAYRYLARMRRADGSYRYSARYVTTPVWVTSQALAALARKPLPLR